MTAIGSAGQALDRPASVASARQHRRLFVREIPEAACRGDLYIDVDEQLWRAHTVWDDEARRAGIEWRQVDLVTRRTRTLVRSLAAGMSAAALGLLVGGAALLQWLDATWGWPLTLTLWVLAIGAIVTADVAVTAQSRMVTTDSLALLEGKELR